MIDILHVIGLCPDSFMHMDLIDLWINVKVNHLKIPKWNLKIMKLYSNSITTIYRRK